MAVRDALSESHRPQLCSGVRLSIPKKETRIELVSRVFGDVCVSFLDEHSEDVLGVMVVEAEDVASSNEIERAFEAMQAAASRAVCQESRACAATPHRDEL